MLKKAVILFVVSLGIVLISEAVDASKHAAAGKRNKRNAAAQPDIA